MISQLEIKVVSPSWIFPTGHTSKQLMAMGLTRGAEFTVMRIAPLGDPIEIKIRGSALSLRKSDTFGVQIETKDR